MTKPLKVRGHTITLTQVGRDWDVRVEKGAFVVVGMFDAGGLTLSEHTPDGKRVDLRASLVDAIEDRVREAVEGDAGEDEDDDTEGDRT